MEKSYFLTNMLLIVKKTIMKDDVLLNSMCMIIMIIKTLGKRTCPFVCVRF